MKRDRWQAPVARTTAPTQRIVVGDLVAIDPNDVGRYVDDKLSGRESWMLVVSVDEPEDLRDMLTVWVLHPMTMRFWVFYNRLWFPQYAVIRATNVDAS